MRQVIIGLIVVIVILALIGTLFIFIPRFFQRDRVTIVSPSPSLIPVFSPRPTATTFIASPLPTTVPGTQVYNDTGFTLSYPASWGLLSCSNSRNFEFDPVNNVDQSEVICDVAQKPITVVVENDLTGCTGDRIQIGNVAVIKLTSTRPRFTETRWCTVSSPVLKVTQRVADTSSRGVSQISYVAEVENMIATLRTTAPTATPFSTSSPIPSY